MTSERIVARGAEGCRGARATALLALVLLVACGGCWRVRLPEVQLAADGAPESVGLSWRQAVALALEAHPDILQARAELESKAHSRNIAFGAYLPSAGGSINRKRSRTTTSSTTDSLAFDLDITQPIFTGFATTGEFLQAKREWEAAQWSYRLTSADVRLRLRSAFVQLLQLQQLVEVNRRIADRRRENADLIRLRYEAGREHRGSLLRAEAIAEEAAFERRQAERRLESQQLTFGRELGGQLWLAATLSDDLEQWLLAVPELPSDYAALAEQTPTVQRLIKTAEASRAGVLVAQSELWPTVEGSLNYGYSGPRSSRLRDDASAQVAVSVPLFEGGRNVEGVRGARADYEASVEAARSARDEQIAGLSTTWTAFRDARELVEVRRRFLEASRERADIVRSQYTSGLSDFQDFDIAEQELASSEKAYVASLADVLVREATWEAAKGSTLEEALDAP